MAAETDPLAPIPLAIVTGFLGAGKTTRLNRWLQDAALADTLVIINEFGSVGLDHLLVEAAPGDVVLLAAGCLCCSMRGDLAATLEDLLRRRDNGRIRFFRRVLIETTGLADPLPILQTVLQHPYFAKRFSITGLITLVDAVNGREALAAHPEARRQAALADRLVITKADLANADALAALDSALRALNPLASPEIDRDFTLSAANLFADHFVPGQAAEAWLGRLEGAETLPNTPHAEIATTILRAETPIAEGTLTVFREAMRMLHGPRMLRMKGLVAMLETPDQPLAIHQVQSVVHPATRLARWPSRDRRTRIVCITQGVEPGALEAFWQALVARKA